MRCKRKGKYTEGKEEVNKSTGRVEVKETRR